EGDSGTKQAVFEVRLSEAFTSDITLDYTTVDGTATAGSDYTATSGSVTFIAGQTVAAIAVDVAGDTTAETAENFSLVVETEAPIFNNIQDSAGIATLLDDDTSESLPEISALPGQASESGDLYFDVFLSEASLSDITVEYRAVPDGSALVDASDFGLRSPADTFTLTIQAGQTHATINYSNTRFNGTDEVDENFTLQFSNPDGAVLAGGEQVLSVTGVFLDDDGSAQDRALFVSDPVILEGDSGTKQAVFEVRLSEAFTSDITLDYTTADDTATAGSDYTATSGSVTFIAGQTVAAIAVDVAGDFDVESAETFFLRLESADPIFGNDDNVGIARILNNDTPNEDPNAYADSYEVDENDRLTISSPGVLDNDTDDGVLERATVVTDVENGTLVLNTDGSFVYTPDPDFNGSDSFVYRATDNRSGTDDAMVSITVNSTNQAPNGIALSSVSVEENAGANAEIGDLSATDPDNDALLFTLSNDAGGRFKVEGNVLQAVSGLDYEAASSYAIEVVARDPDGAETSETFTINVINDPADDSVNLTGDAGPNRLEGTALNDVLSGLGGNDTLFGLAGDDTLNGGDGTDNLVGGDGNDLLTGGESENDRRDNIFGGSGNDTIFGGYGNDEVRGDAGDDVVSGGFGADTVIGGTGNDSITGSALADLLFGSDGDDFINGGFGYDQVNGGDGADSFFHLGIADHGSDWIQDYNAAEGDVLVFGNADATRAQFQINVTTTPNAGADDVEEAFVIYRPTGQIIWALVDGNGQDEINLRIGSEVFDLTM
ncbi:Ig-like domain-containing protein, partial [Sulfitobacter sp. F26169L]|uniref:Calx-beta domain-containing protein n=2 Tax=Sulfitobacter sp. F26169L TaxID=2996015 RepID=UPI00226084CE